MRTRTKLAATLAAAGLPIAGALALVVTPPAAATGKCHQIKITSTRGNVTTSGGGQATIVADGLIMNTPETPAKVTARITLPGPVPLTGITRLSYTTDRQPAATGDTRIVAAYKLGVDANGDGTVDGVLVYEPLYNGDVTDAEQEHRPLGAAGAGKWWYSAEPGNKQTLAPFSQWAAGTGPVAFPAPEALWFAVEQGTWNPGAITLVNDVEFTAGRMCKRVVFTTPPVTTSPTSSPSASASASTSSSPNTSASASVSATATRSPAVPVSSAPPVVVTTPPATSSTPIPDDRNDDELALTGSTPAYTAGGAVALLVAGGVVLYLLRRRRTRYVA